MSAQSRRYVLMSLSAIVICGQAAFAQTQQSDYERMRREGVERNDAAARAQGFEQQRQQQERERQEETSRRSSQSSPSTGGGYTPSPSSGNIVDMRALGQKLLRTPPLPDERNVLLGRWRLEGTGKARPRNETQQLMAMLTNPEGAFCEVAFGSGIDFKPTTFSSDGIAGMAEGPVAYRSGANKQVIVAIPADKRANPISFDVSNPNRIVNAGTCTLVRVGAAATAAGPAPPARTAAVAAPPRAPTTTVGVGAALVDGAAFRCPNGSHFFVSLCQGPSGEAVCKLSDPTVRLNLGTMMSRAAIAAKVQGCEAGGIRYGADDKPIFVKQPA